MASTTIHRSLVDTLQNALRAWCPRCTGGSPSAFFADMAERFARDGRDADLASTATA